MKFLLTTLFLSGFLIAHSQATEKPNIIFIILDDLNDYTETLGGHPQAETPGISRVEQWGTTFLNAHASAPKCAPSRTSFLTGKEVDYTQVYNNPSCRPFRDYFKPGLDNEDVFTLPEYLKDSAGYFTYGINKVYHCFDSYYDYDFETADPCAKSLSWSKYSLFIDGEDTLVIQYGNDHNDGVKGMSWSVIPDSMDHLRYDYRAVDSATLFLQQYAEDPSFACDKPFCMMIGFRKPHLSWFIPQQYYLPDYIEDYYATPFNYPYNQPSNVSPFNGVSMPPQPDEDFGDYFNLPDGGMGQYVASWDSTYFGILDVANDVSPLPEIDPGLSDGERYEIIKKSIQANAVIAYLAAVKSVDAQINRLVDSLAAYPEIYSNTVIVIVSDHGFTLGEKRHWQKGTMWETDLRVPLVIADLRNPVQLVNNNPVSLLDIFPTLCDLVDIPYPVLDNGTNYFDGHSFYSQLQNPAIIIDKPSLATYNEQGNSQCACFPMYSVRNSNFHYIVYRSNGADWTSECDESSSWTEAELYEIGKNRDVDPNEWNNIIGDSAYQPVVEYLQQFLPDSVMYKKIPFTAAIKAGETGCLLENNDTLFLSADIYDTMGILTAPPDGYIYQWSNNQTGDLIYGTSAEFKMSEIPAGIFDEGGRILFYFQMIDTTNDAVVAIAHKYFYFNPAEIPDVFFMTEADSLTVSITDLEINGAYNSITWNFGDGFISHDVHPGPHTYAVNATYTISCEMTYGNSDSCSIGYSKTIRPIFNDFFNDTIRAYMPLLSKKQIDYNRLNGMEDISTALTIWPNPADDYVRFQFRDGNSACEILIFNMTGEIVAKSNSELSGGLGRIDIETLAVGNYLLRINSGDSFGCRMFSVEH